MKSDAWLGSLFLASVVLIVGFALGLAVGYRSGTEEMRREAIKANVGAWVADRSTGDTTFRLGCNEAERNRP